MDFVGIEIFSLEYYNTVLLYLSSGSCHQAHVIRLLSSGSCHQALVIRLLSSGSGSQSPCSFFYLNLPPELYTLYVVLIAIEAMFGLIFIGNSNG
jgi:hypothetical protein